MRGAVFLDRDGVLNAAVVRDGRPYPPRTAAEVEILPGVADAIARFRAVGLATVVITNQPDIARGATEASVVAAINDAVATATGVEHFEVCSHDDDHACGCRKPRPGMILAAARAHGLDLGRSVLVGDRWRDIAAGQAAGLPTVLVDRHYDERRAVDPSLVVGELAEAVPWILERTKAPHP